MIDETKEDNYISKMLNEHNENNGLYLLNIPTGWGKSYHMHEWIYEMFYKNFENIKDFCIFVTSPSKKNLNFDTFKSGFKAYVDKVCINNDYLGFDTINCFFEDRSIILKRNDEFLYDNFLCCLEGILHNSEIASLESFIRLKKIFEANEDLFFNDNNRFRVYEKEFREDLKKYLRKKFADLKITTYDNKINWIKERNNNFYWLKKLYPQIEIQNKQIIFMSTLKSLYKVDPIIDATFYLSDFKKIKDSYYFIDEFDSAKADYLHYIIDNNISPIDLIQLFLIIYNTFQFSFKLDNLFETKGMSRFDGESLILKDHFSKLKIKSQELYELYKLDYSFKYENKYDGNYLSNFIFSGIGDSVTMRKKNEKFFYIENSDSEKINKIIGVDGKVKNDDYKMNFVYFIKTMKSFLENFVYFSRQLCYFTYKVQKIILKKNDIVYEFELEHVIHSYLKLFNFDQSGNKSYYYLYNKIFSYEKNRLRKQFNDEVLEKHADSYFYNHGFTLTTLKNSYFHFYDTIFDYSSFSITPEELLIDLSSKCKVIGLSATALSKTNIDNFDLNYIKENLENFYMVHESINETLKNQALNYDNWFKEEVKINISTIYASDELDEWELIDTNQIGKSSISLILNLQNDDYYKKIYLKLCKMFANFLDHKDSYSCLVFMNLLPKEMGKIDDSILKKLFEKIIKFKQCQISGFPKELFFVLSTSNFQENLIKLHGDLKIKKKCFVITTYSTMATGQNIQYIYPEEFCINFKINNLNPNKETRKKDFDEICLFLPRNMIPNSKNDEVDYSQEQFILDAGFKSNYFYYDRSINYSDFIFFIRGCIYKRIYSNSFNKPEYLHFNNSLKNIKESDNYLEMINRVIEQACGRICRTPVKNENIYMSMEDELYNVISKNKEVNILNNPEIVSLFNYREFKDTSFINIKEDCRFWQNKIRTLLKNIRCNDQSRIEYDSLRNYFLKKCTISKDEFYKLSYEMKKAYLYKGELNSYSYHKYGKEYQYASLNILKYKRKVTEQDCRLNKLMKNDVISIYFDNNKFQKSFSKSNEYIINPIIYNNIYKGILGEAAFEAICEKLSITLEPLSNNIKELFDYKVDEVYIDVKNWKEQYNNPTKHFEKVKSKISSINCKRVIFINIMHGENEHSIINLSNLINKETELYTIPYIINKNGVINQKNIQKFIELLGN